MGGCCTTEDRKGQAAHQLESIFAIDSQDFHKSGTIQDFIKYYDMLDEENQSHKNCVTSLIYEKKSGE